MQDSSFEVVKTSQASTGCFGTSADAGGAKRKFRACKRELRALEASRPAGSQGQRGFLKLLQSDKGGGFVVVAEGLF